MGLKISLDHFSFEIWIEPTESWEVCPFEISWILFWYTLHIQKDVFGLVNKSDFKNWARHALFFFIESEVDSRFGGSRYHIIWNIDMLLFTPHLNRVNIWCDYCFGWFSMLSIVFCHDLFISLFIFLFHFGIFPLELRVYQEGPLNS